MEISPTTRKSYSLKSTAKCKVSLHIGHLDNATRSALCVFGQALIIGLPVV